jgi:hypothetical protein
MGSTRPSHHVEVTTLREGKSNYTSIKALEVAVVHLNVTKDQIMRTLIAFLLIADVFVTCRHANITMIRDVLSD